MPELDFLAFLINDEARPTKTNHGLQNVSGKCEPTEKVSSWEDKTLEITSSEAPLRSHEPSNTRKNQNNEMNYQNNGTNKYNIDCNKKRVHQNFSYLNASQSKKYLKVNKSNVIQSKSNVAQSKVNLSIRQKGCVDASRQTKESHEVDSRKISESSKNRSSINLHTSFEKSVKNLSRQKLGEVFTDTGPDEKIQIDRERVRSKTLILVGNKSNVDLLQNKSLASSALYRLKLDSVPSKIDSWRNTSGSMHRKRSNDLLKKRSHSSSDLINSLSSSCLDCSSNLQKIKETTSKTYENCKIDQIDEKRKIGDAEIDDKGVTNSKNSQKQNNAVKFKHERINSIPNNDSNQRQINRINFQPYGSVLKRYNSIDDKTKVFEPDQRLKFTARSPNGFDKISSALSDDSGYGRSGNKRNIGSIHEQPCSSFKYLHTKSATFGEIELYSAALRRRVMINSLIEKKRKASATTTAVDRRDMENERTEEIKNNSAERNRQSTALSKHSLVPIKNVQQNEKQKQRETQQKNLMQKSNQKIIEQNSVQRHKESSYRHVQKYRLSLNIKQSLEKSEFLNARRILSDDTRAQVGTSRDDALAKVEAEEERTRRERLIKWLEEIDSEDDYSLLTIDLNNIEEAYM